MKVAANPINGPRLNGVIAARCNKSGQLRSGHLQRKATSCKLHSDESTAEAMRTIRLLVCQSADWRDTRQVRYGAAGIESASLFLESCGEKKFFMLEYLAVNNGAIPAQTVGAGDVSSTFPAPAGLYQDCSPGCACYKKLRGKILILRMIPSIE